MDVNMKRIEIWGMIGVEKTSILQNLSENEQVIQMFDVLFVTITEEVKEEQLQSEIAQQLGVSLQGITDREAIASVISNALH